MYPRFFRLILLGIVFSFGLQSGITSAEEGDAELCSPENRWALLVVAGASATDSVARTTKETTVEALKNTLSQAGYPRNQILVLSPEHESEAQKPSLANVRAQLPWLKQANVAGPIPGQTPIRQLNEACEVFVYVQMLGVKLGDTQYLCPTREDGQPVDIGDGNLLLPATEISDALAGSTVERRFLVMNLISPTVTRGSASRNVFGADAETLMQRRLQDPEVPTSRVGFCQIVVNDQIGTSPGTVDSFSDMFLQGLAGFADRSLMGNRDGYVSIRELAEYLEYYGNLAAAGSVKTLFHGHDYALSKPTSAPAEANETSTVAVLERVGKAFSEGTAGGTAKTSPSSEDYQTAVESFRRARQRADEEGNRSAADQALRQNLRMMFQMKRFAELIEESERVGYDTVLTTSSATVQLLPKKDSGTGRRLAASTPMTLKEFDSGWFRIEIKTPDNVQEGWVQAGGVPWMLSVVEKR